MSELDLFSVCVLLLLTHVGFFIAGFHFAIKLVNQEVNK